LDKRACSVLSAVGGLLTIKPAACARSGAMGGADAHCGATGQKHHPSTPCPVAGSDPRVGHPATATDQHSVCLGELGELSEQGAAK